MSPATFTIGCSAGDHPITVYDDWSFDLGVDPELERIAQAFGGARHSCIDSTAADIEFARGIRRTPLPIEFHGQGSWGHTPVPLGSPFAVSVLTAAADYSLGIAKQRENALRIRRALVPGDDVPPARWVPRAAPLLIEPDGIDLAWSAGVSPQRLVAIARATGMDSAPRSVFVYLMFAYGNSRFRMTLAQSLGTHYEPLSRPDSYADERIGPIDAMLDAAVPVPPIVRTALADPDFRSILARPSPRPDSRNLLRRGVQRLLPENYRSADGRYAPELRPARELHKTHDNLPALQSLLQFGPDHAVWNRLSADTLVILYTAIAYTAELPECERDRTLTGLAQVWEHAPAGDVVTRC